MSHIARPIRCIDREQTASELDLLAAQVRSGYCLAFGATMLQNGVGRIEKTFADTPHPEAPPDVDPIDATPETPSGRPPRPPKPKPKL